MIHLLRTWEEKCFKICDRYIPRFAPHLRKRARFFRYLVAGGTAASVDFFFLYTFTEKVGLHYLVSAALAFVAAFCVSFLLQKFWTFQDDSIERVHTQVALYFIFALMNLGINTALMYLFVDVMEIWYMGAQFLASGLIAFESFFIGRYFIFTNKTSTT